MKEYTDITIVLDRSGSMESIKHSMESGFNELVQQHKAVPTTRFSLIQFDDRDDQEVVYTALPVESVPRLVLNPRGWTPLIDAACKAIDRTGRRLADMREADRPDQVLFVMITDGQENASKTYRRDDLKKRIQTQQDTYKWQFIYLGANQDAIAEAASFGIKQDWALTYAANAAGAASTYNILASNTVDYARSRIRGASAKGFTKQQREEAAADKQ